MRIAYICSDPGIPVFGTKGASVHLREVVRGLQSHGHEVVVFSPAVEGEPDGSVDARQASLADAAADVARSLRDDVAHTDHLANELGRLLYNEHLQHALLPHLEALRPNFIYERYSLFGYAGGELARRFDVPLLLEVNAPLVREQEEYRTLALKSTAQALEARIFKAADAIFVVSEALAEHARSLGVAPERVTVLPNAVDANRFSPNVDGSVVRRRHGLESKRVVGFVGSLKQWHDLDTLVEAVRRLHARDERYHLLVVGEGPRLEELQALDAPFLTLTGAVEHDAVPSHLAAADVIAVPYDRADDLYFSPLKLFEAMAMAKPVVGARIGQVADVLEPGRTGLVYEPGEAADLASQIESVYALPDEGRGLGAAAREVVLDRYTWRGNAGRIAATAQRLIGAEAIRGV